MKRLLLRCACGFAWYSENAAAASRSVTVHGETCARERGEASIRIFPIQAHPPDFAHHCREDEPPQIPPASRDLVDGCSWNCRGSYSWHCFCPCQGARHGETHLWAGGKTIADVERAEGVAGPRSRSIIDRIIAAKPDRNYPRRGRKST